MTLVDPCFKIILYYSDLFRTKGLDPVCFCFNAKQMYTIVIIIISFLLRLLFTLYRITFLQQRQQQQKTSNYVKLLASKENLLRC